MAGSSSLVYLLAMIGYNSVTHDVVSVREMSWHRSHSDCLIVMQAEQDYGRRESFNHNYVCLPVIDAQIKSTIDQNARNKYPRRYGSGNLTLRW